MPRVVRDWFPRWMRMLPLRRCSCVTASVLPGSYCAPGGAGGTSSPPRSWAREPYADMWSSLDGFSYGKMMRVMLEPGRYPGLARERSWGSIVGDGWLGAYFANFPAEDMTILMMTQRVDYGTSTLTRKLRNLILSSEETRG